MDDARDALDGVQDRPARSLELARRVLDAPGRTEAVAVVARWALGRALQELGEPARAAEELREAALRAEAMGDPDTQGRIDMSLAWALMAAGDTDEAMAAIDRADASLTGPARARVGMQRGLLLFQLGRLDEASAALDAALPVLRRAGDRVAVARLLVNRSAVATACGRWSGARDDLVEAAALARQEGLGLVAAGAEHNLGFLAGRRGDVPGALAHFDRAAEAYSELEGSVRLRSVLAVDRCEVLLAAGLAEEARSEARRAVDGFETTGSSTDSDEARLLLARAELAAGDAAAAESHAAEAEAGFLRAGRDAWAALAAYTGLLATVACTEHEASPPATLPERIRDVVARLGAAGWAAEAAHARTFLARTALATGRIDEARAALTGSRAASTDAALLVRIWHGRALLRLADGDRAGAARSVRRGLQVVDSYRHSLGATELRASASSLGSDLARLGLRLAVEGGRAPGVLAASERHRAATLRIPPVRPHQDPELGDALAELREAEADRRAALLSGGGEGGGPVPGRGSRFEVAAARTRAAERRVRDITRRHGGAEDPISSPPTLGDLRSALGSRTLVSYVALDRRLLAVVVGRGCSRLVELGDAGPVEAERNHLLAALRRGLQRSLRSGAGDDRAAGAVVASCARLDDMLLAPLDLPGTTGGALSDVVVVPTAFLHALPWGALPRLHHRGVTVAPSATMWLRRGRGPAEDPTTGEAPPVLVAGPDLASAAEELDAIAELWPRARRIDAHEAVVATVLAAMEGAPLVHLSAHGTFRADSPLFSNLRLTDGVLTVYDVEQLERAPRIVVLPACSAAAADVRSGDELLGTSAALLSTGVTAVVAPVVAIPDRTAAAYTLALHRSLRAGMPVARAAAEAASALRAAGDPLSIVTAASFVCMGADDRVGGVHRIDPVSALSRESPPGRRR